MLYLIVPIAAATFTFVLGILVGRLSKSFKKIGRFMINDGDPQKDAFWLEIDYDLDVIERQDVIGFEVKYHSAQPPKE